MKQSIFFLFLLLTFHKHLFAQDKDPINLDENKVVKYVLPDVLKSKDGKKIKTVAHWNQQRPILLSMFQKSMYGKMPGKPPGMHYQNNSLNDTAFNGKAIAKQVTIFFTPGTDGPGMQIVLYVPKNSSDKVPVFIGLNFYGNHTITNDTSVLITKNWVSNNPDAGISNNQASAHSRGLQSERWEIEKLIDNGYGVASAYYGDLEPDHIEGWKTGIRTTLSNVLRIAPEEWSAIGAWAWGLSRMMDYLATEKLVDAKKVIVTGHSRLGKAALWAGASDTRFAAVVSNNSGEGGAALSRRNFGETITRINTSFPHWFVAAYKQFNGRPGALPFDQHMLLALIAPRPLYVASAADDQWADPKGEFLSAWHASTVYQLYKLQGVVGLRMPPVNKPTGNVVRYHIRTGKHDINSYDWSQYILFADALVK